VHFKYYLDELLTSKGYAIYTNCFGQRRGKNKHTNRKRIIISLRLLKKDKTYHGRYNENSLFVSISVRETGLYFKNDIYNN
jgi:hypothetical protein